MLDLMSPDLSPALGEPFSQMEHAFRRLTKLVEGMSQEELEYVGPAGNVNSTAMLIAHLAYADLGYLHSIMGTPIPPDLEAAYGPFATPDDTLPKVTGKTPADLLAGYQQVLTMAKEYLQSLTDADATRAVTIPWWPQPATVRYVLWHLAGHSMLHQGQIARLQAWYKAGAV